MSRASGNNRGPSRALGLLVLLCAALPIFAQTPGVDSERRAEQRIADAEAALRRAESLRDDPDFAAVRRRDPELDALLERAGGLLTAARSGLERARKRPSPTAFEDTATLARSAAGQLAAYETRVRELLRRIDRERDPPPEPKPRPPRFPGPALVAAADAYFAGDYDAAVARLDGTVLRGAKARAHGLLLRAAARYARYLLDGEHDVGLRGEAIDDVLACRAADPALEPDETVFSPRFRDFFAAVR